MSCSPTPPSGGPCHLFKATGSGACSSPRRPAGGGARQALGSSSCPAHGGAPRNAAGLRCGGAARVPSRPVRSGRPGAVSLPGHAGPRAGGHQVSALREQRLPSPAPGPGATPGPAPVRAPRGWALALGLLLGPRGPEVLSFRVRGTLVGQRPDTRLPCRWPRGQVHGPLSGAFCLPCWSPGLHFPDLFKEG